ncbi:MAG TPA: TetR/AcrR family transcriptional regulator [Thermoleophilaceae bacterium]|nr:TetR/AcrR family transcriptional regulator [Thermoleophilaceae bacterium]
MTSTDLERKRIPAAERRLEVLRAAAQLFGQHGYAATKLDDVAAAAGVTKPIVYRHFASKKALYLALLAKHERDLPTFVADVQDELAGLSEEELVRAILAHWLDYVRENRHAWLMLFRDSSGDAEIQAFRIHVSARARAVMAAFVAAQAGDRIPADQVEPTAELLRSGLAGLALWWIDNPEAPKADVLDVAVRLSAAAAGAQG